MCHVRPVGLDYASLHPSLEVSTLEVTLGSQRAAVALSFLRGYVVLRVNSRLAVIRCM